MVYGWKDYFELFEKSGSSSFWFGLILMMYIDTWFIYISNPNEHSSFCATPFCFAPLSYCKTSISYYLSVACSKSVHSSVPFSMWNNFCLDELSNVSLLMLQFNLWENNLFFTWLDKFAEDNVSFLQMFEVFFHPNKFHFVSHLLLINKYKDQFFFIFVPADYKFKEFNLLFWFSVLVWQYKSINV